MADYINPRAHACQNCVKAKAKCYGHTDGKCERCKRLNRDCVMQEPTPRRRKPAKTAINAQTVQISQLEQKVDGLLSLLDASRHSSTSGEKSTFTPESTSNGSNAPASTSSFPDQGNTNLHGLEVLHAGHAVSSVAQAPRPPSVALDDNPELESMPFPTVSAEVVTDPDVLLNIFRRQLARQVPFISLPADWTTEALSKERPFLYRAIIVVASYHDSVRQIELGDEFARQLTEHLIFLGERNLDLLQALLVYISWYNSLFHARPITNTLLGLAFSLVVDLNLYLPPQRWENHERFVTEMKGIIITNPLWGRRSEPSKEEKRTTLGCFYLFSSVSSKFCKRLSPLHWTLYIQQCYEDILKNPENGNDIYLAHLVELLRIDGNIENVKNVGIQFPRLEPPIWNCAVGVHLKLLMSELQKFKASLPESLQQDSMVLMHYHAVEINLFDLGFSMPLTAPLSTQTPQRTWILFKCLSATQALVNIYLSIDSQPYISWSSVVVAQVYLAMNTLSKLTLFDAEDWDLSNVLSTMNLSSLLDRIATRVEEASARYDRTDHARQPWLQISRKMRQVQVVFDRMLACENRTLSSLPVSQAEDGGMDTPFYLNNFDLLDDGFWQTLPDGTTYLQ